MMMMMMMMRLILNIRCCTPTDTAVQTSKTVKEYKGISWYGRFGLLITILVGKKIKFKVAENDQLTG
jgi:hypothetical protein